MTYERLRDGGIAIWCGGKCDGSSRHRYYGYSVREALALFRAEHRGGVNGGDV